jgi:hypothetical protein
LYGASFTGKYNLAVGQAAGQSINDASQSMTILGSFAMQNATGNASSVTAVGFYAGLGLTTSTNTVMVGSSAGRLIASGSAASSQTNSVFIGRDARPGADTQTNQVVIGDSARGNGSNTTTLGNSSTTGTFIPAGNLTLSNGNLILGTSGNGIDFSATANSSGTMTSELLDDYEEGTWTPVVRGSSTAGTYELTTTQGHYTKIGRQVFIHCNVITASAPTGGGVGDLEIAGLPFTSSSAAVSRGGSVYHFGVAGSKDTTLSYILSSSTVVSFGCFGQDGTQAAIPIANVDGTDFIGFQIMYFV